MESKASASSRLPLGPGRPERAVKHGANSSTGTSRNSTMCGSPITTNSHRSNRKCCPSPARCAPDLTPAGETTNRLARVGTVRPVGTFQDGSGLSQSVEGVSQNVGASRTGEVQITRPWQGPVQPAGTNVKGPTGGLASRSACDTSDDHFRQAGRRGPRVVPWPVPVGSTPHG